MQTKEKLYKENQKLIESISKQIANRYGLEKDDCVCEGNLIFCQCVEKFNQSIGNFQAYLSKSLYNDLTRYAKRERKIIDFNSDNSESELDNFCQDYNESVKMLFENMSADCKYVLSLVFNPDVELSADKYTNKKVSKRKLVSYLRKENWKFTRIDKTFHEIKVNLSV